MIIDIINELKSTDKSSVKLQILKKHADNELLKEAFYLAYCKQVTFGVKKYPKAAKHSGTMELQQAFGIFKNLLATRTVTGNDALDMILGTLEQLSHEDAEVAMLVLNRDLECGCSATTANKVWKNLIPQQPCHLASSYSEKTIANIVYPAYAQLKSDGARGMADCDAGLIYTRAGNNYLNLDALDTVLKRLEGRGIVLDGELVYMPTLNQKSASSDVQRGFEPSLDFFMDDEPEEVIDETKQAVIADRQTGNGILNKSLKGTISKEEADCIVYTVWDVIDRDVYYGQKKATVPYRERFEQLKEVVSELNDPRIQIIENHVVNSLEEARTIYNHYINLGLEGIILKNLHGVFENRRSKDQVKFKEVIDFDAEIIGFYPHEKDPNKLGGLVVRSSCGNMQTNTGSGLTDTTHRKNEDGEKEYIPLNERDPLDREYLWNIRESLIGKIVAMECNALLRSKTRKEHEPPFSLFLPIIIRFRDDKSEANSVVDVWPNVEV